MKKIICIKLLTVFSINLLIMPLVHAGKRDFRYSKQYRKGKNKRHNAFLTKKQKIQEAKHKEKLTKIRERKRLQKLAQTLRNKDAIEITKKLEKTKKTLINYPLFKRILKASISAYAFNQAMDIIKMKHGVLSSTCMGECEINEETGEYGCSYIGQFSPDPNCEKIYIPEFGPLTALLEKVNYKLDSNKALLGSYVNLETIMISLCAVQILLTVCIPIICCLTNYSVGQRQSDKHLKKQNIILSNKLDAMEKRLKKYINKTVKTATDSSSSNSSSQSDSQYTTETDTDTDDIEDYTKKYLSSGKK